jgi:hypothetical protein
VADPNVDELNATTLFEIFPRVVKDNYFLGSPLLAYVRDHCLVPFRGGSFMQNTFLYQPMLGDAYATGDTFNIQKQQTLAATRFDMKTYVVSVPEFLEDIEITNKGPLAVFSRVKSDLQNAIMTLNAKIAIAFNRHGQAAPLGVADNRVKHINGWAEALNDGVTSSWDGNYFPYYGAQIRNGAIGAALNSTPVWMGDQLGNPGMITYAALEEMYQNASINSATPGGSGEPDLGACNKAAYAYAKERMQVQQRFEQERDPIWGMVGWRFNSAMILKDDYFPSSKYGKNDTFLGNYLTAAFTSSPAPASSSGLPAAITVTPGEVFAFFNTRANGKGDDEKNLLFRVSDSALFGGGFTGFKPAQDSTKVVGQVLLGCNVEFPSCRLHCQAYGINS